MPVDNLTIGSGPQSPQLKSLVQQVYSARALARQLLEQMKEMNDGTDYTHLETQFGLQTGAGTTVFSLAFTLANGAGTGTGLENSAITQFCGRLN